MLAFITGIVLVMGFQDDPVTDFTKEYTNLVNSFISADNYTFQIETKDDRGGFGRRRRGGEETTAREPEPVKTIGVFKKGQPLFLKRDKVEAFSFGEDVVYRSGEEEWKIFDLQSMFGGMRRRPSGDEQPKEKRPALNEEEMLKRFDKDKDGKLSEAEKAEAEVTLKKEKAEAEGEERGRRDGERRGGERGQRGGDRASGVRTSSGVRTAMGLSRTTAPHETLQNLVGKVKEIVREENEGKLIFKGVLTKEGVEALSSPSSFNRMRRGREGGESEFEQSGSVLIIATKEGVIEKIEIKSKTKGSFMDRDFEMSKASNIVVSKCGVSEIKVPTEVMEKMEL